MNGEVPYATYACFFKQILQNRHGVTASEWSPGTGAVPSSAAVMVRLVNPVASAIYRKPRQNISDLQRCSIKSAAAIRRSPSCNSTKNGIQIGLHWFLNCMPARGCLLADFTKFSNNHFFRGVYILLHSAKKFFSAHGDVHLVYSALLGLQLNSRAILTKNILLSQPAFSYKNETIRWRAAISVCGLSLSDQ